MFCSLSVFLKTGNVFGWNVSETKWDGDKISGIRNVSGAKYWGRNIAGEIPGTKHPNPISRRHNSHPAF